MIEHGLVTGEQAAQRIEEMSAAIPDPSPTLAHLLEMTVQTLRQQDAHPEKRWQPSVIPGGLEDPDDAS